MDDIFDRLSKVTGITKYSGSEVITPKEIVADMVDLLPAEVFNKDSRFLDPAVKSGRFLVEIYRRLMDSDAMKQTFPDQQARRQHILDNQLYGFATSAVAATMVRKQLYDDPTIAGNIHYTTANDVVKEIQGAFGIMKFDVVIGNPPYNRGMDLDFVNMGFEMSTQYTVMITPAKWQTAEANQNVASKNMSYGKFRQKLAPHMSKVVFYPDAGNIFDISQVDGITYFLMEKSVQATCIVENKCATQPLFNSISTRSIIGGKSLHNIGQEIIDSLNNYRVFTFGKVRMSDKYKVMTSDKIRIGGRKAPNDLLSIDGKLNGLGISEIVEEMSSTNIAAPKCIFSSNDLRECNSFISWLNTKFTRFFVVMNISKLTGTLTDHCFRFVPAPPSGKFDHIYTDQELYQHYKLPQKYIDVIEAVIKERK